MPTPPIARRSPAGTLGLLALLLLPLPAQAHEVRPAIADLEIHGGTIELRIAVDLESLIAGVDMSAVANTDDSPQAAEMTRLRALPPGPLDQEARAMVPRFIAMLDLRADGTALPLSLQEIVIDPVGDVDLPRDSLLVLEGALPWGADSVDLNWPAQYGMLVLRQQGVDDPFTGYLSGQRSPEIPVQAGLWARLRALLGL